MASEEYLEYVGRYLSGSVPLTPRSRPTDEAFRLWRESKNVQPAMPALSHVRLTTLAGIECVRVDSGLPVSPTVILYLHGGGYVYSSAQSCIGTLVALARTCEAVCIAPNYRRVPDHPFPAPVDDALACYRALLEDGTPADRVVVAGNSAGGGLVLATLFAVAMAGLPMPLCATPYSPWTDITTGGRSAAQADDPVVDGDGLRWIAACYLAGADPRTPLASPLFAADDLLRALPPTLIQVGLREALLDDSRRFVARAANAGTDVTLIVHEGMVHMWAVFMPEVPESMASFAMIRDFVAARRSKLGSAATTGRPRYCHDAEARARPRLSRGRSSTCSDPARTAAGRRRSETGTGLFMRAARSS